MTETRRSADLYGLLLDDSSRVLMLPDNVGGWTLPCVHVPDDRSWSPMVGSVRGLMRSALAAEATVLRVVYVTTPSSYGTPHVDILYALENHTENWTPPPHARWIGRQELTTLPLAHPEHHAVIQEALREAESGVVPHLRPPW